LWVLDIAEIDDDAISSDEFRVTEEAKAWE
jgi:hypothetical protein